MTSLAARLGLAVCAALPLTSCATVEGPGPAPIPLGEGVYALGNTSGELGSDGENYRRAVGFCFEQGRQVLRLPSDGVDQPGRIGEFRFRCVGPGESGWKEPAG